MLSIKHATACRDKNRHGSVRTKQKQIEKSQFTQNHEPAREIMLALGIACKA
jgi:hypothetical protein